MCPRHVFREVRIHQQNKWKLIKTITLWPFKTRTYSKSAQDYKHNWNGWFRSIWPLAARPQLTIYARSNFTFKSPAAIKIHTYFTHLNGPLNAIRAMFSLLWRVPFSCHSLPSWSLSRTSSTFALKPPAGINIPHRTGTFGALVPAGRKVHFLSKRDLGCAQDTFFVKCEFLSKTHGN